MGMILLLGIVGVVFIIGIIGLVFIIAKKDEDE